MTRICITGFCGITAYSFLDAVLPENIVIGMTIDHRRTGSPSTRDYRLITVIIYNTN